MSKASIKYVCQSCGYESPRWVGKCPNCDEWSTFVEELRVREPARKKADSEAAAIPLSRVDSLAEFRYPTGIAEFDRVLGGGIVPGSVVLLGGDPGIGKSTLMMQMASHLTDRVTLYVTGEESVKQIKLRSDRLNFPASKQVLLLAETNLAIVLNVLEQAKPDLVVVDSIQTMYRPELESGPGSVGQVRE
ncbi:MAG: ATPase domain-containing protein, partial [Bacteroidota bacterium]